MSEATPELPYSWLFTSGDGLQRNECSFTWTIENFSFLTQEVGDTIRSDKFRCCESLDCCWSTQLNPMGQTSENKDFTYLFLYFHPHNNVTAYVEYKFSARNINNKQFWKTQGNHNFKKEEGWGYPISKSDKIRKQLMNDVLKLHIELTVFILKEHTSPNHREKITFFSSTRSIFEKHTFRWNTANFFNLRKIDSKSISSPLFFQNEQSEWQWRLELKAESTEGTITDTQFILGLVPMEKPDDVRCPLQYNIWVKNSRNKIFKTLSNKLVFCQAEEWHTIGKEKELLCHFKDGFLQLQVTILAPSSTENFRNFRLLSHEQNCTITDEFATMFKNGEHSDMTIFVQGKKIPVHKCVLAVRSPVFRSMLQHDTLEKQEGKIEIKDLDYETMMHVLSFMYTNKFTAEDDENVMEVLKAAEKYQIVKLKKMCEEYLVLNLNTGNVSDILSCAETYQASALKDEALNFTRFYCDDFISSFSSEEM